MVPPGCWSTEDRRLAGQMTRERRAGLEDLRGNRRREVRNIGADCPSWGNLQREEVSGVINWVLLLVSRRSRSTQRK